MKKIPLTQGKFAIVDDADYKRLSKFKWYVNSEGYAMREYWENGVRIRVRMHREINQTPEGMDTDHVNGIRLDNQRGNLRSCTRSENLRNGKKRSNNTSIYKGVSFFKPVKMWRAYINMGGKQKSLGYFKDENQAAIAYNEAAKEHFGKFASLNKIQGGA